ncbi:MAG: MetQ/NlpA family ABC transporter substrate-binding protein [Clostridia bacterium]|nr:MetQ/NlpA family ABC transporter substrate-binding protein [Clostridia bacterium]
MKKFLAILLVSILTLSLSAALAGEAIVIGATPTPHAEILELIKDDLAALGYDLEIQIFTEYPIPNPATTAGDLDANYFQHIPYLSAYNESISEDSQLVAAIPVHYEPYGIYAGTKATLGDVSEGDSIAITNDPANITRALLLLQEAGLLKLPEGANTDSVLSKLDIVENPYNLEFFEMNAELIPASLGDVSYAVINGNFAISAGLKPGEDALQLEDPQGESGKIYTNYVVVRPEDKDAAWVEALRSVLQSDKVRDYMNTNEDYAKGVIPVF